MFDRLNGRTLAVGDEVAVIQSGIGRTVPSLDRVKRVLKRYVELEGKGLTYTPTFNLEGDPWPRDPGFHGSHLEHPVTQKHRDAIRRMRMEHKLMAASSRGIPDASKYHNRQPWEAYSLEALEAVVALLQKDLNR